MMDFWFGISKSHGL